MGPSACPWQRPPRVPSPYLRTQQQVLAPPGDGVRAGIGLGIGQQRRLWEPKAEHLSKAQDLHPNTIANFKGEVLMKTGERSQFRYRVEEGLEKVPNL